MCIYGVIYLGFKINKNGVTPIKEKNENLRTTKEPHNVWFKIIPGTYYHYYFKNVLETSCHFTNFSEEVLNGNGGRNKVQRLKMLNLIHEINTLIYYEPNKPL